MMLRADDEPGSAAAELGGAHAALTRFCAAETKGERRDALAALLLLGAAADRLIIERFVHGSKREKNRAREALVATGRRVAPRLVALAAAGPAKLRRRALSVLWEMPDAFVDSVYALLDTRRRTASGVASYILAKSAPELAQRVRAMREPAALPVLARTGRPSLVILASAVLRLYAGIGDTREVEAHLVSPRAHHRLAAAGALGAAGTRQALPALRHRLRPLLGEWNPRVRDAVRRAINDIEHYTSQTAALPRASQHAAADPHGLPRAAGREPDPARSDDAGRSERPPTISL
jgi:hypothetical protein